MRQNAQVCASENLVSCYSTLIAGGKGKRENKGCGCLGLESGECVGGGGWQACLYILGV